MSQTQPQPQPKGAESMTTNAGKNNGLSYPFISVKGKLIKVHTHESKNGNVYEHVINLPNDDPYEHPPGITIKSKTRLGNEGEVIETVAQCFRRGYKAQGQQRYSHEFWHFDGRR